MQPDEIQPIVYNEAIKTIEKLTNNQLKILTLNYLLCRTKHGSVESWETFDIYLNKCIKPFLGFKETKAEFEHIQYSGCGYTNTIVHRDILNVLNENYYFLFMKSISERDIKALNLDASISKRLFVRTVDGKIVFSFANVNILTVWWNILLMIKLKNR